MKRFSGYDDIDNMIATMLHPLFKRVYIEKNFPDVDVKSAEEKIILELESLPAGDLAHQQLKPLSKYSSYFFGESSQTRIDQPEESSILEQYFSENLNDLSLLLKQKYFKIKNTLQSCKLSLVQFVNFVYFCNKIDKLHRVVNYPLNALGETINFIYSFKDSYYKPNVSNAFSFHDLNTLRKQLQSSVMEMVTGVITNIGNWTSFCLGLLFIFRLTKFLANTIINGVIITYAFGFCNLRILFSCRDYIDRKSVV